MALGATPGLMVRQVLSRVLVVLGIGLALGAGASVWTLQLLESLLYGLEPSDPRTWAMAVSALAVTGVLAGWLPARRATRVDPMLALRCD
jgi:ABC-type antimicrobial peptide transport system permease subunit